MQQSQGAQQTGELNATIHPATTVGTVDLKVGNLKRSLKFYNELIGLQTFNQTEQKAVLGAGNRIILRLEEVPGAQPQPRGTTGLYHAAILFPDRHSLAVKISQIAAIRYPLGWADHLVSESCFTEHDCSQWNHAWTRSFARLRYSQSGMVLSRCSRI